MERERATRNLRGTSVACVSLVCQFARMSRKYHADDAACAYHPDNILCKCSEKLTVLKVKPLTISL
jgi:hypothetical protein